jgi:hypothetical protein
VTCLFKEPLLHFLLLGAAIFVAYSLRSQHVVNAEPGKILVTRGQVEHLAAGFTQAWMRPPSDAELKGLIDDWVREEIAVRESLAMGLDKDDAVIRRRLRQKIEFISDDTSARAEPTDADLNKYLLAHPDAFHVEERLTFRQIYLSPERRGEMLAHDAGQFLAQLNRDGETVDIFKLGDPSLLPPSFAMVSLSEVAKQFGKIFAAQLGEFKTGQWQGPINSSYGAHLVFISERSHGRAGKLADVRDDVRREWTNARRLEATEKFYEELLKQYVVTIQSPEPVKGTRLEAGGSR